MASIASTSNRRNVSVDFTANEFADRKQDEHGEDEDAGVLGGEAESCGKANQQQSPERRRFHVTVKRIDGGEHEAGDTDVCGDDGAVGDEVGIEDEQCERNE